MSVTVYAHLPSEIRRRVGARQVTVQVPEPATFESVIRRLASEVDPSFLEVLSPEGDGGRRGARRPWMRHVLVNDRWLDLPRDLAVELRDEDHLYFIQPVAGG